MESTNNYSGDSTTSLSYISEEKQEIKAKQNFKLTRKIGSGAFGEIYHAFNTTSQEQFAIKLEHLDIRRPQLYYEARILSFLQKQQDPLLIGFPRFYYYTSTQEFNLMVIELLGPSLEDMFSLCNKRFSLKTVLLLSDQMLTRLENLHKYGFLHRDVKPENFLLGFGKNNEIVYLIDFGLSKKYLTKEALHIPFKEGKKLTGTARYASLFTHLGYEQSRRDDIESLGYMMVYFLKGNLPWQNIKGKDKDEKYLRIKEKKSSITVEELCEGLPEEVEEFLKYCRKLGFEHEPNYDYLRKLIRGLMDKGKMVFDYDFDWNVHLESKKK